MTTLSHEGLMNTFTFVTYLTRDMEMMPVGLLTLAQLARERGMEVDVIDLPHLKDEDALVEALARRHLVGFSTLCTTFHRSLRLADKVKARNPAVTVVMGGPQASAVAVPLLHRHACVDLVFRGEAEAGWSAFLEGVELSRIPGLVRRGTGGVLETPPPPLLMELDRLPLPAFDIYPPTGLTVPLETGRGCPFGCTFCSTNRYFSRRFRAKSPQRILLEMDRLHALYGVRVFDLIEDSFTTNRRKILAFCDAIGAHPERYTWHISARPDQVDETLLQRLRNAGCRGVYFGVETGSQRMQKVIRKKLRVTRAAENIALTRRHGLAVTASFVVGFPDEAPEDLRATLRLFGTLSAHREMVLQMHLLSPLAGSALVAANLPMAYDGMPTDFNDLEDGWDQTARERFQGDRELFPHLHHFSGTRVPRERYLFLTYMLQLGGWFFPNFLHGAFVRRREAWIDHLLGTPIPPEMVRDPSFPTPMAIWSERAYRVCAGFARNADLPGLQEILAYDRAYSRVSHLPQEPPTLVMLPRALSRRNPGRLLPPDLLDAWREVTGFMVSRDASGGMDLSLQLSAAEMEARLREICDGCGECCLDDDGLMCGIEEWDVIERFLERHHQQVPRITPSAWQGLMLETGYRYLAQPLEAPPTLHATHEAAREAAGVQGWVRHACAHLELHGERWRCAIQEVKPAECVAYPYRPMGDGERQWHLEPVEGGLKGRCDLSMLLREKTIFRQQYLRWAMIRMGADSGAEALGRLHAERDKDQERRA
ncbi:MAG: radical SAM protein [Magnetococcales bacterium]|nr:radical SAM protein [Magnetococcales bacterium]